MGDTVGPVGSSRALRMIPAMVAIEWVETIVEAALEQSREKFVQALVLDGAVSSIDQAVALADDLLAAQSPYLGWDSEKNLS